MPAGDSSAPPGLEMPEFTRSLRGFTAIRSLGTREHELVWGPLIAARRSAEKVQAAEARVSAFDPARLRKALRDAISALAKSRGEGTAAKVRAYEARLEEAALAAFSALDALGKAAADVKTATMPTRVPRWRAWCGAVQALFDAVDGFWLSIDDVAPPPRGMARLIVALIAAGLLAGATSIEAQQRPRDVVRVEGVRAESLLARGYDVVGREGEVTLVVATPEHRAQLVRLGARVVALPVANQAAPVVYRSYDDPARGYRRWSDSIVASNPRVSVDTIGRTFENRPMLMMKVGPKGDSPQRPNVLFMATYHAREWAATETARRLVQWLAAPPGTDARRDSLVQSRDIYIMPVANPDGYQFTFTNDRLWRKTRAPQPGGAIGADMNRNHSVNWGLDNQGSSPEPGSEIYRGPTPASEIETRNIEAFHAAHPPVVALSYHTFAGLILYPSGSSYGALAADLPVYRALAGTNLRSAITDRLPFSIRAEYAPGPGWFLYTTNGEFTDFASTRHGALAFTTELTSGYGPAGFYGFEFPDDEALLERLFQDALPFALDLLDAARAPMAMRSANIGAAPERVVVESIVPDIRVTVPAASAASAKIVVSFPLSYRIDSTGGGRHTRRLVTDAVATPVSFKIEAAGSSAQFRRLDAAGAEQPSADWAMTGTFARDSTFAHSGRFSFMGQTGTLTTSAVMVPADADTVSLIYWTMHFGSGFSPEPSGRVEASTDGGTTWSTALVQRSSAPAWYTDRAVIGGVRNKSVRFRFVANGMIWRVDDVAILAHGPVTATAVTAAASIRPSENPVRSATVRFSWPFVGAAGEMSAFDFAGREVWRNPVGPGDVPQWDVTAVTNGVYVVIARSGKQLARLKLFVARGGP